MGRGPLNPALPDGAEYLASSSGNVANASAVATLTPRATKTAFISQLIVTAAGATAALAVNVTVTGLVGGTQTFTFVYPAGATIAATPLVVSFPIPLKAATPDTNIVVTLPASGLGGTNAAVSASGYSS